MEQVTGISDLQLAVLVAAATIIGAAIGGAITGIVTLRAEDKRHRFQRDLERDRQQVATVQAARLVAEELTFAMAELEIAVEGPLRWLPRLRRRPLLPVAVWENYKAVLAAGTPFDAWDAIATVYADFYIFTAGPGGFDEKMLAETQAEAEQALAALAAYLDHPVLDSLDLPYSPEGSG